MESLRYGLAAVCLIAGGTACVPSDTAPGDSRSRILVPKRDENQGAAVREGTDDPLVDATSDAIEGMTRILAVVTDDTNELLALRVLRPHEAPARVELGALRSGAVLYRMKGRDVLTLYAGDVDPRSGGVIRLHYLYEGKLIGRDVYRDFYMHVTRDGEDWVLNVETQNGLVPFTSMYLAAKRNGLGMVVGIERITVR